MWGGTGARRWHLEDLSFPIRPLEDTVVPQGRARLEGASTAEQAGASDDASWHFLSASSVLGTLNTVNSTITRERDDEIYFTDEVKRIRETK